MWRMHEGAGWWMIFGWLWFAIFWGGIIALVIWVVRKLTERGGSEGRYSALDIAKQRYARGEISREEFEQIKKDLLFPTEYDKGSR
jgi:putative membrane protein